MAKAFAGKSKLNIAESQAPVIAVKNRNTTSGSSPFTARLTLQEKQLLQQWVTELQKHTNKRLTASKVLRGLVHMQDKINRDKLIQSILEHT